MFQGREKGKERRRENGKKEREEGKKERKKRTEGGRKKEIWRVKERWSKRETESFFILSRFSSTQESDLIIGTGGTLRRSRVLCLFCVQSECKSRAICQTACGSVSFCLCGHLSICRSLSVCVGVLGNDCVCVPAIAPKRVLVWCLPL
ncbi:unnamed protein product [Arctogadus glacialis]